MFAGGSFPFKLLKQEALNSPALCHMLLLLPAGCKPQAGRNHICRPVIDPNAWATAQGLLDTQLIQLNT